MNVSERNGENDGVAADGVVDDFEVVLTGGGVFCDGPLDRVGGIVGCGGIEECPL